MSFRRTQKYLVGATLFCSFWIALGVPPTLHAQTADEDHAELFSVPPHCAESHGGRPTSLAVNSAGHIYFSTHGCVYRVEEGGHYKALAAIPEPGMYAEQPGLAADDTGNVFISDYDLGQVRKVAADGSITVIAGGGAIERGDGGPATSVSLSKPLGLAVDSEGNLYIAEYGKGRVRKVLADGTITTLFSKDGVNLIAVDRSGSLYSTETGHGAIFKMGADGKLTRFAGKGGGTVKYSGEGGPATQATFYPWGVAVDSHKNIYIADRSNGRILRVATDGTISTVAGEAGCCFSGDGGPAINAELGIPTDVAVDRQDNIYFADLWNVNPNRHSFASDSVVIRKISAKDGTITTVLGGRGISIWP